MVIGCIDGAVEYTASDFNDLLIDMDPSNFAYNDGYNCYILIDTKNRPHIYQKNKDGLYIELLQYLHSINGFNSIYPRVLINNKEETVHRLVAYAFKGLWCRKGEDIDHIDGNHFNNHPDNLRKVSHQENCANRHHITPQEYEQQLHYYTNGKTQYNIIK